MISPLTSWRTLVDGAILSALHHTTASIAPVGDVSRELMDPLTEAASGGKRFRALLMLASLKAHGGTAVEPLTHVAAAIELFQTAALVHDDVLDGSDTRRGRPALHRQIESMHAAHGWDSNSAAYGEAGAILAGDIALMSCHRALTRGVARLGDEGTRVADLFTAMSEMVTAGQYADMRAAVMPLETLAEQREQIDTVMRTKTASYSSEYPLMIGAAASGADSRRLDQLSIGGVDLGLAFQLRDDVLGVVGSPDVTGKPAGDDIREGKRTLLAWHTWVEGNESDRSLMREVFGRQDASNEAVQAVIAAMTRTGAVEFAEERISQLTASAVERILIDGLDDAGRQPLEYLIDAVVQRQA